METPTQPNRRLNRSEKKKVSVEFDKGIARFQDDPCSVVITVYGNVKNENTPAPRAYFSVSFGPKSHLNIFGYLKRTDVPHTRLAAEYSAYIAALRKVVESFKEFVSVKTVVLKGSSAHICEAMNGEARTMENIGYTNHDGTAVDLVPLIKELHVLCTTLEESKVSVEFWTVVEQRVQAAFKLGKEVGPAKCRKTVGDSSTVASPTAEGTPLGQLVTGANRKRKLSAGDSEEEQGVDDQDEEKWKAERRERQKDNRRLKRARKVSRKLVAKEQPHNQSQLGGNGDSDLKSKDIGQTAITIVDAGKKSSGLKSGAIEQITPARVDAGKENNGFGFLPFRTSNFHNKGVDDIKEGGHDTQMELGGVLSATDKSMETANPEGQDARLSIDGGAPANDKAMESQVSESSLGFIQGTNIPLPWVGFEFLDWKYVESDQMMAVRALMREPLKRFPAAEKESIEEITIKGECLEDKATEERVVEEGSTEQRMLDLES